MRVRQEVLHYKEKRCHSVILSLLSLLTFLSRLAESLESEMLWMW